MKYQNDSYDTSWERKLDQQYQKNDRCRKRAYICSPLSADTTAKQIENMRRAREYMLYASEMLGYFTRAPHAYLPMLLCDKIPSERAIALQFGLRLLEHSELLLVCGGRISGGMKGEIIHAAGLGIPITVFNEDLYPEVRKLATKAGASKSLVSLGEGHPVLADNFPTEDRGWEANCLA